MKFQRIISVMPEGKAEDLAEKLGVKALLSGLGDAVVLVNADHQIVWVNDAFTELFGYEIEDLKGSSMAAIYADEHDREFKSAFQYDHLARSRNRTGKVRYRRKSGEVFESETTSSLVNLTEGSAADGYLAIIRDLSENERKQRVLSRLYAAATDQSLEGNERIDEILRIGADYFDLASADVVRVDGQTCEVVNALPGDAVSIPVGHTFNLHSSLNRIVLEAHSPIIVADVRSFEKHHGAFEKVGKIGAFLSAPVTVEDVCYGTVSFLSMDAREPFSAIESDVLIQVAAWIGQELRMLEQTERLTRLAQHDWLTNAQNMRAFMPAIDTALSEHKAGKSQSALVILDLDHFKSVNDQHGHQAGDRVLREAVDRVREVCRPGDSVCRLGGEEFGVLVRDTPLDEARRLAERMRSAISDQPVATRDKDLTVTASFGVAEAQAEFKQASEWIRAADSALYRAKQMGRDRVEYSGGSAS